jgi:hypothetical protein
MRQQPTPREGVTKNGATNNAPEFCYTKPVSPKEPREEQKNRTFARGGVETNTCNMNMWR